MQGQAAHNPTAGARRTERTVHAKAADRRPVFKHVLGQPLVMDWPTVSEDAQAAIFDELQESLGPAVAARKALAQQRRRERSNARKAAAGSDMETDTGTDGKPSRRRKRGAAANAGKATLPDGAEAAVKRARCEIDPETASLPEPLRGIVAGINAVTVQLEKLVARQAAVSREKGGSATAGSGAASDLSADHKPDLRCVLVCRGDMPAGHLYAHLPAMAALLDPQVRMCALSAGAERKLADTLGLKRASVVGVRSGVPSLERLCELVEASTTPLKAPWLKKASTTSFVPTQIRVIATSAPIKPRGGTASSRPQAKASGAQVESDAPAAVQQARVSRDGGGPSGAEQDHK
ncbi:RNase P and RNase MRP subunit [Polyrhizophydium stewartii]|uniref:RNase P and RNase MRP subunit n=1 Tax=Polyrhizophydium stewartii TaxID=2732419 RepID=A0ABR4NGN3_9FUNG|nr:hypothetical protein HK105_006368 [Polyrhizophydium stewartii]